MKNIPNIIQIHHFEISKEAPGQVLTRSSLHSENVQFNILHDDVPLSFTDFPEIIRPSGLTHERQTYLYDKIRRFVLEDKDIQCPRSPFLYSEEGDRSATPPPSTSTECSTSTNKKWKPPTSRKLSPRKRTLLHAVIVRRLATEIKQ
ncbi:hypothetical protein ANN_00835 [Periplaneta americana]|uniref:Uncharacterized protein n=1 Tax=Periplaneta americana TaxID=6978 RepID=A0ABQ8TTK9_PERAM|nr:hypothetical protein ANN_00835 [Periplaneta americana]